MKKFRGINYLVTPIERMRSVNDNINKGTYRIIGQQISIVITTTLRRYQ